MNIGDVVRNKISGVVGTIDSKYVMSYGNTKAWNVKLDSNGVITPYYEDDLELLATAAISTPYFKTGVKVLVNFTSSNLMFRDKPATITGPGIAIDSWNIRFDDGTTDCFNESYLTFAKPQQIASKKRFQKGDLVYITGPNFTGSGVISKVWNNIYGTNSSYEFVADIDGQTRSALPDQVSDLNTYTGSSGQPYVYRSGMTGTYTVAMPQGYMFGGGLSTAKEETKTGCNIHAWSFYQGLNERFEWCTNPGCKAKRDTDKRL
jgi:hypothetical protein